VGAVTNGGTIAARAGAGERGFGGVAIAFGGAGDLVNRGLISGSGPSGELGTGGTAVAFHASATLVNTGTIQGGDGSGAYNYRNNLPGGIGVALSAGGTVTNHGSIAGGSGATNHYGAPGGGGGGIVANAAVTIVNTGSITAAAGGAAVTQLYGGTGAAGVGGIGIDLRAGGHCGTTALSRAAPAVPAGPSIPAPMVVTRCAWAAVARLSTRHCFARARPETGIATQAASARRLWMAER
jgi:hypothetical protein